MQAVIKTQQKQLLYYISPRILSVPSPLSSLWQQSLTKKLWNIHAENPVFLSAPFISHSR